MLLGFIMRLIRYFTCNSEAGFFINYKRVPKDNYRGPFPKYLTSNYNRLNIEKEVQQNPYESDMYYMAPRHSSKKKGRFGKLNWIE